VSATDAVVNTMQLTPGAGDWLVSFSTSVLLGANNSEGQFVIYSNGVAQAASRRRVARAGGSSAGFIQGVAIASFRVTGLGAAQQIDIRAQVSAGTMSIYQRNLTLLKVG